MVVEKVFAVIADSTRRDILEALAQESKAVGQLVDELGVSQPTVSKHLRVLREAGVVSMRAQGQKRFYGINAEPLALVSTWLESLGAGIGDGAGAAHAQPVVQRDAARKPAAAANVPVRTVIQDAPAPAAVLTAGLAAAAPASAAPALAAPAAVLAEPRTKPAESAAVAAVKTPAATTAMRTPAAPVATSVPASTRQLAVADAGADSDGGVPRQLGRSVGRAAKKGADLLATFKRRKD